MFPSFVSAVMRLIYAENLCNFCLRFVVVFTDIS